MKILNNSPELTFNDVLLLPGYSNFNMIDDIKKTNIKTKISRHLEIDIPICSSPMPHVTETQMAITIGKLGGIGFIHCFQSHQSQINQVKEVKNNNVKVAVSVADFSEAGVHHIEKLLKLGVDLICIETAHAFNLQTINFIKKVKKLFPKAEICASLVVTPEATKALIKAGVDSLRVGIGGGSHCTTRLVTGIGRPQLSAIHECYKIAKKYNIPIISDTGIEYSGDISKAIAFGANAVMIGGLFAGTDESPGKIIYNRGKKYKFSAGMCSHQTNFLSPNNIKKIIKTIKQIVKNIIRYNPQKFISKYSQPFKFTHEGVSGLIPYKGSVISIINELNGGLKRSMWYLGCNNLKEIQSKSRVVLITPNSIRDSQPRI